jgi:hypothetical protein
VDQAEVGAFGLVPGERGVRLGAGGAQEVGLTGVSAGFSQNRPQSGPSPRYATLFQLNRSKSGGSVSASVASCIRAISRPSAR